MLPDLGEIQKRRRSFGLSQKQLALYAGVSQSLIAKIEGGKIDPSYRNVKRIFEALDKEMTKQKKAILAREISSKKVIGVGKKDPVHRAIELMRKYEISQLPVYDENTPVGSITEKVITNHIAQKKDPKKLSKMPIEKVMEEGLPQISEDAPVEIVVPLLQYSPAVLTIKKGMTTGIITKADLLKIVRL
ncbi:MAG: helix-turn-helix domain-containing protein [Methanocellales archaeon]|nr:helix-turn-helix domain-containing protein [Methanocellales archaeon]